MRIRPILVVPAILVLVAVAITSVRSQQASPSQPPAAEPRIELGGTFLVVISPRSDMIWAFSKQTGAWYPLQPVGPSRGAIKVTAGECVAILQADRHMYGFSATQGTWDTLELEAAPLSPPTVVKDWGAIATPGRVYAFSGQTGKWAALDVQAELSRQRPSRR